MKYGNSPTWTGKGNVKRLFGKIVCNSLNGLHIFYTLVLYFLFSAMKCGTHHCISRDNPNLRPQTSVYVERQQYLDKTGFN